MRGLAWRNRTRYIGCFAPGWRNALRSGLVNRPCKCTGAPYQLDLQVPRLPALPQEKNAGDKCNNLPAVHVQASTHFFFLRVLTTAPQDAATAAPDTSRECVRAGRSRLTAPTRPKVSDGSPDSGIMQPDQERVRCAPGSRARRCRPGRRCSPACAGGACASALPRSLS